ncbi:hypothetical protein HMPREF2954_00195 [Neisseria sp. HMSC067H09]|nr:hypothetical protein HMPREF2954_00195 [Neisseria sp. HMSC067H09]
MADNVMNLIFPNTVLTVRKIKFLRKKKHPEAILKPDLQSLGYIVKYKVKLAIGDGWKTLLPALKTDILFIFRKDLK